ncbi:DUF819 domain-containing protein [uncultured Clostridium sp.]|uniref:DUF819 family protein n=1 Tax=uncultured Clostridium sp. TaxID=59620 RepID=UPI0025E2A9EA|nr:DUF819 family protein [uncultured Clostridium sp.]
MNTLISADNTWALLSIMCGSVALSIYLEQKYTWAAKISGAILALILAILFTNLNIIPTSNQLYDDVIWGFAVPLAIPLLLLQCNIKKIWKETGRLLIIFIIGAVGSCIGALISYYLLKDNISELNGLAAMMTGSYIGGGINFTALADAFNVSGTMISATTVADNLVTATSMFLLLSIPAVGFFRKHFNHPHMDEVEKSNDSENAKNAAAAYWHKKEISLKDIAINFAYASIVVTFSKLIAQNLSDIIPTGNIMLNMCNTFFGSQYIWITTLSIIISMIFEKQIEKLSGYNELGTYLIYLFFFVIGVPASIPMIIKNAPLLFVFTIIIALTNMLFCFIFGKLLKFNLEDIVLASNANIGGPTTAVAMAISKGWTKLVGPIMLIGTLGYVIGTYFGIIIGSLLGA